MTIKSNTWRGWILFTAVAGATANALADDLSAARRADIIELMALTQVTANGVELSMALSQQIFASLSATRDDVPPHTLRVIREVVDAYLKKGFNGEITERMIPVYAKHFSADEIKGLIAFYRTPLGQKTIAVQPAMLSEGLRAGQTWAKNALPALRADVQQRLIQHHND